jgi:hypothetical protein
MNGCNGCDDAPEEQVTQGGSINRHRGSQVAAVQRSKRWVWVGCDGEGFVGETGSLRFGCEVGRVLIGAQ